MRQPNSPAGQRKADVTLKRNGLTVECFFNPKGRLARKLERYGRQSTEYGYTYDAKDHLTTVTRDGAVTENYRYDPSGRRREQKREYQGFSDSTGGRLQYDQAGRLIRAGSTAFTYDARGALKERYNNEGVTKYTYGKDIRLETVLLPSGRDIHYEYEKANPLSPARRFRSGALTAEFLWSDPLRLAAYRDHDSLLEYTFTYTDDGILHKVRIGTFKPEKPKYGPNTDWVEESRDYLGYMAAQSRRKRLQGFLEKRSLPFDLLCGCDQVGTLKILTDIEGKLVKETVRDSFGVPGGDSFSDLFMPIGFAGGLTDRDTGLVHFGYRDYDPRVGRFTAPDPLGDTGGDHDLYDYCVDDPIGRVDPSGLFFLKIAKMLLRNKVKGLIDGSLFDPIIANGGEIEGDIKRYEEKIKNGTATEKDIKTLKLLRKNYKQWKDSRE